MRLTRMCLCEDEDVYTKGPFGSYEIESYSSNKIPTITFKGGRFLLESTSTIPSRAPSHASTVG